MIQRTVIPTRVASTRPVLLVLAVLLLLRPVPAHAGQDAEDKTSPFASLRWNGDVPEVQVQGDWYRPLVIHDVGVEDILAFLRRTQPSRVRKRFGEDLPETVRKNRLRFQCLWVAPSNHQRTPPGTSKDF